MNQVPHVFDILAAIIFLWTIPWKIYAVWLAAKHNRKAWFVVLVLINSLSILEMIYVFKVEKRNWETVKKDFKRGWDMMKGTKRDDFRSEK